MPDQQQVIELLLEQEEVSWKTILQDLVLAEQMNPWDIDVSLLTHKYIQVIKNMQENNLRISGRVLLAAAILLKIKTTHLVENDISKLDLLIQQTEEVEETLSEVLDEQSRRRKKGMEQYTLIPRHPQPRNRKVSIHDLITALQHAMATKKKILAQIRPVKFVVPKKVDIMGVIREVYHKLQYYTQKENTATLPFSTLLPPRAGRREKVYTFIPLLHLENEQRVEMTQEKPFEEIKVTLLEKSKGKE